MITVTVTVFLVSSQQPWEMGTVTPLLLVKQ